MGALKLPAIQGDIRRRILVNYRVDPEVIRRRLPPPFRPKLHRGYAVAGICLIRLEGVRPRFLPLPIGLTSENAAHRVAVEWDQDGATHEGVFIPRRDSDSMVNKMVGGWLFPGVHHAATFTVEDRGTHVDLAMASRDGQVRVELHADAAPRLPPQSIFRSVAEASEFFERGALGYSSTSDPARFDGLLLATRRWQVEPLAVRAVHSSYFEDPAAFPAGSIELDHALVMRDIAHQWLAQPALSAAARAGSLATACV